MIRVGQRSAFGLVEKSFETLILSSLRAGKVFSVYGWGFFHCATCRLKYIEGLNRHIDALREDKTAAANSLQAPATIHLMLNSVIDE